MTLPLVSIIIPAHRAESFLPETLQSILAQTYPVWEVLVVEDGPPDGTAALVAQFQQTVGDRPVRYFHNPQNLGPAVARNLGIAAAKGTYLAFLDADDLWTEKHLETALKTLETTAGDVAYSPTQLFVDGSRKLLGTWGPDTTDLEQFPASLFGKNYIQPSTVVMRQAVVKTVGTFNPQLWVAEDLDYWLRIAAAGCKFVFSPEVTCLYRKKHTAALTYDKHRLLEGHAHVLRLHRHLSVIPEAIRKDVATRFHLGVVKRNFKTNPAKAAVFLFWALRISPIAVLHSLRLSPPRSST